MPEPERFVRGPGSPPDDEGPRREESLGSLLLRGASVIPFLMLGVIAVISVIAWVLVFIFGIGAQPVWEWADGRSTWEVVTQVALVVLVGLIPVAVLVLSILATSYGARERQAWWFWPFTQVIFTAVAVALVALDQLDPGALAAVGIEGADWWLIFGYVSYAVLVAGLRMRAARAQSKGGSV
jgi:hypothetical protein